MDPVFWEAAGCRVLTPVGINEVLAAFDLIWCLNYYYDYFSQVAIGFLGGKKKTTSITLCQTWVIIRQFESHSCCNQCCGILDIITDNGGLRLNGAGFLNFSNFHPKNGMIFPPPCLLTFVFPTRVWLGVLRLVFLGAPGCRCQSVVVPSTVSPSFPPLHMLAKCEIYWSLKKK